MRSGTPPYLHSYAVYSPLGTWASLPFSHPNIPAHPLSASSFKGKETAGKS